MTENKFGPVDVTCPYCGEIMNVMSGPTRFVEVTHCSNRWLIVDLKKGKVGHTERYATNEKQA